MTDFLNPLGGRFIGRSGPVAPTTINATVPDPPRGFLRLDPGTIIKGVVMGREPDGLVTIATDKGAVRVASNAPLPPGTNVTLEVRPTGDRLQVLILASDAVRTHASPSHTPSTTMPSTTMPSTTMPSTTMPSGAGHPAAAPPPAASPPGQPTSGQPVPSAESQASGPAGSGTRPPTSGPPAPPSAATPPPVTPPIKIVGSTQPAIVLQPFSMTAAPPNQAVTAGQPVATPSLQIQLPNGQVLILPGSALPETPPGNASLPTAAPPSGNAPALPAGRPALHTPLPQGMVPALVSSAPPGASTLAGDAQQRILALFTAPQPATGQAPPSPAPVLPQPGPALPAGAGLQLRVLAVQIGNQHPIEIDPAVQVVQNARSASGGEAHIVFGRVIGLTPAGHAIIHTPVGNIMMQQRSSLPLGAQLALAIDIVEAPPAAPAIAASPVVQTPQQALLSLSRGWPTLADLLAIVQGSAPHAAGRAAVDSAVAREILAHLPQMGSRLGAGLLAGIAALRANDIARFLGPQFALRGLGAEREELVKRLRGEFQQLSALSQDRPEGEWRALFLPYLDDQQAVQRINLFYRRHRKPGEDGTESEAGTRFVVEADFSLLGPFQLDGLMRKGRFDLMVRSHLRVDERMRRDIEAIYEEARGISGFSGAIAFQTVEEFPVAPLEELKHGRDQVTI